MADRIPLWGDASEDPGKLREFKTGDDMVLPGGLKLQGGSVSVDPSTTPGADKIPISRPDGTIDPGWMPDLVVGLNRSAISQAALIYSTTAAGGGIQVASNDNINFGTENFTLHIESSMPDWTPPAGTIADTLTLLRKHDGTNGVILTVRSSTGLLRLQINSTTYDSTVAPAFADGTFGKITVVVTRETASVEGSVAFYQNGVLLGTPVTITAGTPTTVNNTSTLYIHGTSARRTKGRVRAVYAYNRALTAAEVLDLCRNGVSEEDRETSDGELWDGNFDIVGGGADGHYNPETGELSNSGTSPTGGRPTFLGPSLKPFKLYKVTVHLQGNLDVVTSITLTSQYPNPSEGGITGEFLRASGGKVSWVGSWSGTLARFAIWTDGKTTWDGLFVDHISIVEAGCTAQYEPESLTHSQWLDTSGNGNHALLPDAGATLVRPQYGGSICWTHEWSGTQEMQYVGGVSRQIVPFHSAFRGYIDIIASAPVTINIGDSVTHNRYAADAELVAGRNRVQLLTPFHNGAGGSRLRLAIRPTDDYTGTLAVTVPYEILEEIE